MEITFEISISALLSGAIGGLISYYLAIKLNKNSHQLALREEKFDDFTSSLNLLRDMLDIVIYDCKMQVLNYNEHNKIFEHRSMDLFNRIFDSASKSSTLVQNYGKLYEVQEFDYNETLLIHRIALNIAMRMNYYSSNPDHIKTEIEEIRSELVKLEEKWEIFRPKLIEMYSNAYEKRQKDLK
ncbi:MAG: hypothetical protein APF84_00275 [Gracilibacter sp. BRH_c7a]|nr:MAG: hypothetical protein APF84_00275 [Gracilibacter sp. BRH_c7a]